MAKEINLEECVYYEVINRPGLLRKVEASAEKGGLAECYACEGYDCECPDYKPLKDTKEYVVEK